MPLDLPAGTEFFVDSNILYYALVPTPRLSDACLTLLDRAIAGRLRLLVSIPVLSDVIHKVMISEASQLAGRDRAGMVGFLGKHPEYITRLVQYPLALERLKVVPMTVLPLDEPRLRTAAQIAVNHGIFTNDAMIVALMQRNGLSHLVTNDGDFDGIPGLKIWKPVFS